MREILAIDYDGVTQFNNVSVEKNKSSMGYYTLCAYLCGRRIFKYSTT